MKTASDLSELGACYAENLPQIAREAYQFLPEITEHLFKCGCSTCRHLLSDTMQMASIHAWLRCGGRIVFIDPK